MNITKFLSIFLKPVAENVWRKCLAVQKTCRIFAVRIGQIAVNLQIHAGSGCLVNIFLQLIFQCSGGFYKNCLSLVDLTAGPAGQGDQDMAELFRIYRTHRAFSKH